MKKLLTVAGSDSSGGAGIQADLKTFAALGAYGMSCICAVTAQNTRGVSGAENMTPAMVKAQLRAVYDDIPPDALKTGMLSSADIVETVADFLKENKSSPFVADPVMVATSGDRLLAEEAVEVYKDKLIGLADLLTPNIPEAEVLSGISITDGDSAKAAAEKIMEYGCGAVLIKGGHRVGSAADILRDREGFTVYEGEKIRTENTHGTGCTLSAALAVMLARGLGLREAVRQAKKYMTGAIRSAAEPGHSVGHGHGPVDHFWFYGPHWGHME